MKKIVFILLAGLFLAGCADDQYAIEKRYWKLQQQAAKIFNNPHASPPNQLEAMVKDLEQFVKKHEENQLSIDANFNIARLYIITEEFDKAVSHLRTLIDKYKKYPEVCAETVFLLGNSYEIEGRWDEALLQYKLIVQDYPATKRGLDVPLYIAHRYKVKRQPEKMLLAYRDAIAHYNKLASENPGTVLAYSADSLTANCHKEVKDWPATIDSLNSMIEKYKGMMNVEGMLFDIALIYNRELKDKDKTKETLEKLVNEYPESKLTKTATALLKELEKE